MSRAAHGERTPENEDSHPRELIWERIERRGNGEFPSIVDRIVRVAMDLADREGIDAISMRRIASELGSGVMSLYYYVPSKGDLLDLLLDAAIGGVELPERVSGYWRRDLRLVAVQMRACLKRHAWLSGLLNKRPAIGPNRFRQFEFALSVVSSLSPNIRVMRQMIASLYIFTLGFVTVELSEGEILRRAGFDKMSAPYVEKLIATGRFPNLERMRREGDRPPGDEAFNGSLELVLEGIASLGRTPRKAPA
jgi:AcrR family transcriptional regulator